MFPISTNEKLVLPEASDCSPQLPALPRVLRELTAGLGMRLEAVSGHEEAVEYCDITEDEAESEVWASCFPAILNNVIKL